RGFHEKGSFICFNERAPISRYSREHGSNRPRLYVPPGSSSVHRPGSAGRLKCVGDPEDERMVAIGPLLIEVAVARDAGPRDTQRHRSYIAREAKPPVYFGPKGVARISAAIEWTQQSHVTGDAQLFAGGHSGVDFAVNCPSTRLEII